MFVRVMNHIDRIRIKPLWSCSDRKDLLILQKFIYQNCHEKKSTSDLDYFFLNWSVALMYTRNWSSNHFQNVAREWKPTTVTPKCRDVYSRTGIHNQQNMDPRLFQGGSSSISVSRNIFWLRIMFFYIIWLEKPQKTVFF